MLIHSICSLYNWRYRKLGNLPHVLSWPEYRIANTGFRFDYQLINVEDFNGVGEAEPNPYFYQVRDFSSTNTANLRYDLLFLILYMISLMTVYKTDSFERMLNNYCLMFSFLLVEVQP